MGGNKSTDTSKLTEGKKSTGTSNDGNDDFQSQILKDLYERTSGERWSIKGGWDDPDNVPICNWDGVRCDDSGIVSVLNL